ncbi:MAG: hypothetical protein KGY53_01600 [Wenzhouxiangellaceae bacterium]|nr:hypothetical protein [Wenzhouxiangellaceae bacterium]
MSTLSLADLGPRMQHELGFEPPCRCARSNTGCVATIPVIETGSLSEAKPLNSELPGAAWLSTGLHRLRIPRKQARLAATVGDSGDYD